MILSKIHEELSNKSKTSIAGCNEPLLNCDGTLLWKVLVINDNLSLDV